VYDKLGETMRASLHDFCQQTDLLDWNAVQTYLCAGHGPKCWYLLNLALWWQRYIAADSPRLPALAAAA
jgi:hypothetical protein